MFYEKIELGLDRVLKAAKDLGNPQNSLKIIHIAGTNGKGSVGELISANLISQGYKVGHFSSPAILSPYDIWRINGKNITEEEYKKLSCKIDNKLTQFEKETLIAYTYFRNEKCDYAVIETGMGGRLDATNIADKKEICVITPIDIDHTKYLGNTIYEIAKEKAGIIKGNAAVSYPQRDETKEALKNTYFCSYPENIRYYSDKTVFDYGNYKNIEIPLLGAYQAENAALASEALIKMRHFNVNGFKKASWHCRFEKTGNFILDGAHNLHGIRALEKNIDIYLRNKKITYITGVFADKDYKSMAYLAKYAYKIYTVESDNPRCLSAEKWAYELSKYCNNVKAIGSIKKAAIMAKDDETVLVFGSLSLMAEAYKEVKDLVQ